MSSRCTKVSAGMGAKRDTPKILIEQILELVKKNGHYKEAESIMDYFLPSDEQREISNYEFDFCALVNPGKSEGIYIDVYLTGKFDQSGKDYCRIATFKTLCEDVGAFKIMGELCGSLTCYANQYINSQLYRYFTPEQLVKCEADHRDPA